MCKSFDMKKKKRINKSHENTLILVYEDEINLAFDQ